MFFKHTYRKLDYLQFSLSKNNYLSVKFGSGLDKTIPSKSPLENNFRCSLAGDINDSPGTSDDEIYPTKMKK